jgi:hypothetical protein
MTTINLSIGPIVSLIAGVLILIVPRLLNYIVAIYLILIGLIGLFGWGPTHLRPTSLTDPTERALVVAPPPAPVLNAEWNKAAGGGTI